MSPVAADKGAPPSPRFTAEETILLRGLGSGASSKEMAAQMRLPRESLYRLIGDLRRKTGASSDTALAVWVLRNMGTCGSERRGGGR
jgi:DNA-binding CsgD family transcriptional regulator